MLVESFHYNITIIDARWFANLLRGEDGLRCGVAYSARAEVQLHVSEATGIGLK